MNHAESFFAAAAQICRDISFGSIEALASELDRLRDRRGRLFLLGVGGSAANCSHAVNDFRKLCGIETYSPVDNVSELTARTNDEGWDTVFAAWLETSRLNDKDAILVYSVGGGGGSASSVPGRALSSPASSSEPAAAIPRRAAPRGMPDQYDRSCGAAGP